LSQSTLERRRALLATNAVSRQDVEERTADLASKRAAVRASQANVKRLEAMAGFKRIVAPFEGVVTARDTELGALVSAGGSGPPLFVVSDVRKLRAYVNVPQTYATAVRTATRARISVPEHPGRTFPATFEGSAQAVDVGSGTTRVQLIVDNPNGELLAGGFARVHLELPAGKALQLPATALIFDRMGMRVATLRDDNSVALKPVEISRDLGRSVEIASGLTAGDRVIDNPPDGIVDGEVVRVFGQPAEVPAPPTAASVRPDRRS
jgi:RND family efflux transporter MFP subunit